jgi:DNA-binding transcriptional LysR family regulator
MRPDAIKQPPAVHRTTIGGTAILGGMNTDAVLTFTVVADEGQFQLAASRLGLSQQAISKRVAALEAELGTALFRRTPAGAALTEEGRRFLPHARAIVAAVSAGTESVRSTARPLRVDVMNRRSAAFELLRGFHEADPARSVEIVAGGGAAATIRALLAGEADAGYAYLRDRAAELGPRLSSAYAYLEPLEVIVGARHPLAQAGHARLPDLARYPAWVPGIVPGSEWEAYYADLTAAFGLDVDPTGYAAGAGSVFDAVAASSALCTFVGEKSRVALPSGAGTSGRPALVRLPVTGPVPLYPWSLIWPSSPRHPGTRRLIAHTARGFRPRAGAEVWLPR